jgi:hypothetical protein
LALKPRFWPLYCYYTAPQRKKRRETPPTPPHQLGGWQPRHTTYTTQPINPNLDVEATGAYELTHHPTNPTEVLIHSTTGRLIATMTKSRLQKLRDLYRPNTKNKPIPQAIAELILRQKTKAYDALPTKARPLHKQTRKQTYQEPNGTWIIPDHLYDKLHKCVNIKRVLHCDPITLPLRAKQYIYHDTLDSQFGAAPYTDTAWPGTSLAIPDYTPDKLTRALEQAIYSAHAHRHTRASSHILILPN